MAVTYTEAKATLDEIASRSETNRKRIEQIRSLANQVQTDLGAMSTDYSSFVSDLDTAVSNNPNDTAWQTAGAEKDQMVTDFNGLKATADTLKAAIDSV